MSAINITTANAIAELKKLIQEVEALKKSTASVAGVSETSFAKIEASIKSLQASTALTSNKFKYLEAVLIKQIETTNALAAAQNKATQATTNTGNQATTAAAKMTQANAQVASAYNKLVIVTKAAQDHAREMTLEYGRSSAQAKDATAQYAQLNAQLKQVNTSVQQQGNAYSKLTAQVAAAKSNAQQMATVHGVNSTQAKKATVAYNQLNAQLQKVNNTVSQSKSGFFGLSQSFGKILSAFGLIAGVQLFANILKGAYSTIKTFDSLTLVIEKVSKTSSDLRENQRFLIDITRDYGVELVSTTTRYLKFLAAAEQSNISLKDTQNIFRSMTKAGAVLGLQTDELSSIYLALEQMLSKGKVTTEELRRQLGERLPGAMGIMAASMGVTISQLDKMMKKGEVLSAEVLPGFAEAVEIAFGIETLDKIDTLIAAENRLDNAWKQFVKDISDGNGVIVELLKFSFNLLEKWIMGLQLIFNNSNFKKRENELEYAKFIEAQLSDEAEFRTQLASGVADEEIKLREDADKKLLAISKATTTKGIADAEEARSKALKTLQEYYRKVEAERTAFAKQEFADVVANKERLEKALEANKAKLKNMDENDTETNIYGNPVRDTRGIIDVTELIEKQTDALAKATIKYDIYKKQITESIKTPKGEGDGITKRITKRMRDLNEILDLTNEINAKILESSINLNERLIESDESTYEDKVKLVQKNLALRGKLADIAYAIDIEKAEKHLKDANDSLDKSVKEGTLLIKDANAQKTKLQKEFIDREHLADLDRYATNAANAKDATDKILAIYQEYNAAMADQTQTPFNNEIAGLKKVYNASKKTKKDQVALENGLRDVAVRAANAKIDILIEQAEYERDIANQSQENIDAWIAKIAELEASRPTFTPTDDELSDSQKFWDEMLDMAAQANQAIGDLVDAGFERRLEMIDAEIDAEQKKYDRLVQMAGDDKALKESLQVEYDAQMAILEKKKLMEERKQAKARKVSALAEIAISTAQAIMSIWAQVPKFDFGISAGVMTGFVSALGAIQMATVLATPIPQYKDGIENVKNAHTAMINDGRDQEYIGRGGNVLTTKTKNAIVNLQPGDTVYKNFDDLASKSKLMSLAYNGSSINKSEFDMLFDGITSSISEGLSKARINNNVKLNMRSNDDSYRRSLSKWS